MLELYYDESQYGCIGYIETCIKLERYDEKFYRSLLQSLTNFSIMDDMLDVLREYGKISILSNFLEMLLLNGTACSVTNILRTNLIGTGLSHNIFLIVESNNGMRAVHSLIHHKSGGKLLGNVFNTIDTILLLPKEFVDEIKNSNIGVEIAIGIYVNDVTILENLRSGVYDDYFMGSPYHISMYIVLRALCIDYTVFKNKSATPYNIHCGSLFNRYLKMILPTIDDDVSVENDDLSKSRNISLLFIGSYFYDLMRIGMDNNAGKAVIKNIPYIEYYKVSDDTAKEFTRFILNNQFFHKVFNKYFSCYKNVFHSIYQDSEVNQRYINLLKLKFN